ncbi:MAG: 4-(cytidine 5'-diphospho)-2-C-methyl-D-erythritol kinase [Thermodesulfobium narugense]|nr:MAG: 4-(cytidine 5'-diphospho)-2-C-methyl-D-erythritol kinase [Thermodesulfobium narugense]
MFEINAFAKVNLSLDVIGKYPDGYHEIRSVFHSIELFDLLRLELIEEKKLIIDSNIEIKNNVIHKIWNYVSLNFDIKKGLYLYLGKSTPLMGGLGGGSSDAAAFLYAINLIFSLGLSREDLVDVSINFGSDIAYFFYGGMCLVDGRGEKVFKLDEYLNEEIILVIPNKGISTSFAYSLFDKSPRASNYTKQFFDAKKEGFIKLGNVFEDLVLSSDAELKKIKEILNEECEWNLMSGSGSVFYAKTNRTKHIEKKLLGMGKVITSCLKPLELKLIEF